MKTAKEKQHTTGNNDLNEWTFQKKRQRENNIYKVLTENNYSQQ